MQNNLAQYLNRNLKDSIENLRVVQGTAKDSGNIYYCIEIVLNNGFSKRLFLRDGEEFAFRNAFDLIDTNKSIEF